MEFSRLESWSGKLFPSPGDLPDPEIEPGSPALQADSLLSEPQGAPISKSEIKWWIESCVFFLFRNTAVVAFILQLFWFTLSSLNLNQRLGSVLTELPGVASYEKQCVASQLLRREKMNTASLWNSVWETGLVLWFIRNKKNKQCKWRTWKAGGHHLPTQENGFKRKFVYGMRF